MTARQFAKHRETFCLASAGSDEEFRAYLSGFDAAVAIADLAAVPAQVRGKPLHEKADDLLTAARELAQFASYAEIVGGVSVNRNHVREWCDKVFDIIRGLPEDENFEPTLIATIEPQPDPRDEVIARLVEALVKIADGNPTIDSPEADAGTSRAVAHAALAAAKAVQHG